MSDATQPETADRSGSDAPTCSPSSLTPETDAHWKAIEGSGFWNNNRTRLAMEKMERERNEARHQLLAIFAREHLTCGWCGEMMHAPPGFHPPMTTEKLKATVRLHLLECPKHPIRETEKELEELITAARAVVNRWDTPPATAKYINQLRAILPENVGGEARCEKP